MKEESLTRVWALTIDQRQSRRRTDLVDAALHVTVGLPGLLLAFERTAGDEIQGLLADGAGIVRLVTDLARLDAQSGLTEPGWRIGIGLGDVESLRVESTRAARGSAYISARQAVDEASRAPVQVALRTADPADRTMGDLAEAALILLRGLLTRRTVKGWEVVDALESEATQTQVAQRLGVSESAVSQRLGRAEWREGVRGGELATSLLTATQRGWSLG